jgi:tRNA-specific 2-thiouridylase
MDYRKFLQKNAPGFKRTSRPGPIIATRGKVIGRHRGIAFYTIGQRQGLRVAMGVPLYITRIDPRNNSLFVGSKEDAMGRRFLLEDTHFVANAPKKRIALKVKIRYNHPEAPAYLERRAGVWQVRFIRPQFAITSGQSAVFYLGDRVIGGGIIAKAG